MAVYLRGSTWWTDVYPEGRSGPRKRVSTGFKVNEKARAEVFAAQLKAGQAPTKPDGKPAGMSDGAPTLKEAIARAWREEWDHLKDTETKRLHSEAMVAHFGADVPVTAITRDLILKWRTAILAGGVTPATANRKLAALGRLLTMARDWGFQTETRMPLLKETEKQRQALTPAQIESVIAAESDPRLFALWVFLRDTACRVSEAQEITWDRLKGGRAVFAGRKAGDVLYLPLSARTAAALDALRDQAKPFPLSYAFYRLAWRKACAKAGIILPLGTSIHITRHSTATELVAQGISIRTIQGILGHSSVTTTERYAKMSTSSMADALGTLHRGVSTIAGEVTESVRNP